jgi:hypothetical protein
VLRSWKKALTVSTSSFEPVINPRGTFASVFEDAPEEHRLAPLAGPKPLGNAADKRIDDHLLRRIALAESIYP